MVADDGQGLTQSRPPVTASMPTLSQTGKIISVQVSAETWTGYRPEASIFSAALPQTSNASRSAMPRFRRVKMHGRPGFSFTSTPLFWALSRISDSVMVKPQLATIAIKNNTHTYRICDSTQVGGICGEFSGKYP